MSFFANLKRAFEGPDARWLRLKSKTLIALFHEIDRAKMDLLAASPPRVNAKDVEAAGEFARIGILATLEGIAELFKKDEPIGHLIKAFVDELDQFKLTTIIGMTQGWVFRQSQSFYEAQLAEPAVPQWLKENAEKYVQYYAEHLLLSVVHFPERVCGFSDDPGQRLWDPITSIMPVDPWFLHSSIKVAQCARLGRRDDKFFFVWAGICGFSSVRFFELCDLKDQFRGYAAIQYQQAIDLM
jgi:hypothetical protein